MQSAVQWPDLHCPHEDQEAINAILAFSRKWKPNVHVLMGDVLNLSGISRHVHDDLIEQYTETVGACLKNFGKIVDEIAKVNPKSRIVWIWGNHDERLRAFVRKNPSWRDVLDKPLQLLKAFGECRHADRIELVQFDDPEESFLLGKMAYVHGHYVGKHCASQHVEAYGESVTFAHAHTMQMFTAVRRGDPIVGYCIGNLMNKNGRKYLKGRPHRWVTGFAFIEWEPADDNDFTQHPLPIVRGKFRFAGKTYSGRA